MITPLKSQEISIQSHEISIKSHAHTHVHPVISHAHPIVLLCSIIIFPFFSMLFQWFPMNIFMISSHSKRIRAATALTWRVCQMMARSDGKSSKNHGTLGAFLGLSVFPFQVSGTGEGVTLFYLLREFGILSRNLLVFIYDILWYFWLCRYRTAPKCARPGWFPSGSEVGPALVECACRFESKLMVKKSQVILSKAPLESIPMSSFRSFSESLVKSYRFLHHKPVSAWRLLHRNSI